MENFTAVTGVSESAATPDHGVGCPPTTRRRQNPWIIFTLDCWLFVALSGCGFRAPRRIRRPPYQMSVDDQESFIWRTSSLIFIEQYLGPHMLQ